MSRALVWIDPNGVEYELSLDVLGLIILDGPIGLDAAPQQITTAPRTDAGAVLVARRHTVREINLPVFFEGVTHREAMAAFVHSLNLGAGQLRHVDDDGRERTLRDVLYDGGFEGDDKDARSDWSRRVLNFVALDPYWYDAPDMAVVGATESDYAFSQVGVDFNAAGAFSGAAYGNSGVFSDATVPFNNADTAFSGGALIQFPTLTSPIGVWPTITVHGPASYLRITQIRDGVALEIVEMAAAATLAANETLVIVTRPQDRSVQVNGVDAWDRVTSETSATVNLLPGELTPVLDVNGVPTFDLLGRPITVQGVTDRLAVQFGGTLVSSYVQVAWEERWLTP